MSETPEPETAESVAPIREEGDVSLDELTDEQREALEAEVAELHRIAAENPEAGH